MIEKFAKQDLSLARKTGMISIVNTKFGVVDLIYNPTYKNYSLKWLNCEGNQCSISDKSAGMISFLVNRVYNVIVE
jgi:hypothetical protein